MGQHRDVGPALKHHWIKVTWLLVCLGWYDVSILEGPGISVTQILCKAYVIGQKRPSRPMISLRSRSAYLRMFFTTVVAVASEANKPRVRFSKAIHNFAKYCIDIMIHLVSRLERLLAFPSSKLLLCCFLKIILA